MVHTSPAYASSENQQSLDNLRVMLEQWKVMSSLQAAEASDWSPHLQDWHGECSCLA